MGGSIRLIAGALVHVPDTKEAAMGFRPEGEEYIVKCPRCHKACLVRIDGTFGGPHIRRMECPYCQAPLLTADQRRDLLCQYARTHLV